MATKKIKASEAKAQGMSAAMILSMIQLGKYENDLNIDIPSYNFVPSSISSASSYQFPETSDLYRPTPNSILRTALFSAIQGKSRRRMEREIISSLDDIEIRFSGIQLDQSDLDVWESLVFLSYRSGLSSVEFSAYSLLKFLKRSNGSKDYAWLYSVFVRLSGSLVEIKCKKQGLSFFGSLLSGSHDEKTKQYKIDIQPKLLSLYRAGWTAIDTSEREKLRGKPLALWLSAFYSSHAAPFPYTVDLLYQLSGSSNNSIRRFTQHLINACNELLAIQYLESFDLDGGILTVTRANISQSQKKHLSKKIRSKKSKTTQGLKHISTIS